jgi:hypothetical protein
MLRMSNIKPVVFPIVGTATELVVTILPFMTNATTAQTYYELQTDEGVVCLSGNYTMTEEQYDNWGTDNTVVDGYVAEHLGIEIL